MNHRSLVSINDLSKEEMIGVLNLAEEFERNPNQDKLLRGKIAALLFFEPSTRTRLSFESAIHRLGGRVIGFSEVANSSVSKGETLKDTILTVANYSDVVVMRHSIEGGARYASEIAPVPIINAGDGANQHPTQTILDLYSIRKTQGTLSNLNIAMVGDLKYGRTVHSLIMALSHFGAHFTFVSPRELQLPPEYKILLDGLGLRYSEATDLNEALAQADIVYMTRVQRERFSDPTDYERVKNAYILREAQLRHTKPNLRVLHPLPRVNEIHTDVDPSPKAYYFAQALNGVYTRMAIVSFILGLRTLN